MPACRQYAANAYPRRPSHRLPTNPATSRHGLPMVAAMADLLERKTA
ncbi:hypothetical protein ACFP51_28035 [Streptomyces pratens]|uniref:Uncharacterized protein n=1 Tax=Streptomyces pratens TaxID=887456 RepID=A0ABW1M3P2_9ACTN